MAQYNLNRRWIFESSYETSTVLYPSNARGPKQNQDGTGGALPRVRQCALVVTEVPRVDRLEREYNAAGR